jgi:hypothetical protein
MKAVRVAHGDPRRRHEGSRLRRGACVSDGRRTTDAGVALVPLPFFHEGRICV